jgi:hypothetical protein
MAMDALAAGIDTTGNTGVQKEEEILVIFG